MSCTIFFLLSPVLLSSQLSEFTGSLPSLLATQKHNNKYSFSPYFNQYYEIKTNQIFPIAENIM